ncbi:Ig-like domain-containing protein [Leptospira kirschneri]|uniref:Ig-like domain-containing protein n=1 Tax=Leptospira kirschneri TaxID=29507 RepID=UPI0002BFA5CD|nr:Ig-like domain-containing protein [Leptospira kirschneri]EMN26847.1 Ig-like protein [Leptospira kirschneri serovar Sokoine str. RM1]
MTYTFKNHKRISIIQFCIRISFFIFVVLNLDCQDTGEKLLGLGALWGDPPPEVIFSSPVSGTDSLPSTQKFDVGFSREMNMQSCRIAFSMSPQTTGFFTELNGTVLTFAPSIPLNPGSYTYTVTKNCEDKAGLDLKDPFSASITIGNASAAGLSPSISGMFVYAGNAPVCNAGTATMTDFFAGNVTTTCMGNPLVNQIVVNFSRPMNTTATLNALSISPTVSANYVWNSPNTLTIQPDFAFNSNQRYIVNFGTGAKDQNGIALSGNTVGTFFVGTANAGPNINTITVPTGSLAGCQAGIGIPTDIIATTVNNGCLGNPNTQSIVFNFNTPMNTAVTQAAIGISPPISGTFVWSAGNQTLVFTTDSKLEYGTRYTISIGTSAQAANQTNFTTPVSASFIAGGNNPNPIVQAIGLVSQVGAPGCAPSFPAIGSAIGGNWTAASCWWDNSLPVLQPSSYRFEGGDEGNNNAASCNNKTTDDFRLVFNNYMNLGSTIGSVSLSRESGASTVIRLSSWNWSDCQAVYPFGCRVLDLRFSEMESSCGGVNEFGSSADFNLTNAKFDFSANNGAIPYPAIPTSPNYPIYTIQVSGAATDILGRPLAPFSFSAVSQ